MTNAPLNAEVVPVNDNVPPPSFNNVTEESPEIDAVIDAFAYAPKITGVAATPEFVNPSTAPVAVAIEYPPVLKINPPTVIVPLSATAPPALKPPNTAVHAGLLTFDHVWSVVPVPGHQLFAVVHVPAPPPKPICWARKLSVPMALASQYK